MPSRGALTEGSLPIFCGSSLDSSFRGQKDTPEIYPTTGSACATTSPPIVPQIELPRTYLGQTLALLEPLCAPKGTTDVKHVQSALGKASRIGYILQGIDPLYIGPVGLLVQEGSKRWRASKVRRSTAYLYEASQ